MKRLILHSGHTFSTRDSFPPGVLPIKRHVIERILHLKNFRTFNAANDIAREIYDRWVWCNVYPIHLYTISKKVQSFVNCFSALDRWSKKKRGEAFLQMEKEFMSTIDEIFDVFCADDKQRRILEKQHGLKMTDYDLLIMLFIKIKLVSELENVWMLWFLQRQLTYSF